MLRSLNSQVSERFMSDNENHNMLLRRNNKRLLRKEIIKRFIFIKVFKTYFSINSVSVVTELVKLAYHTIPIGTSTINTLIHPVIASIIKSFVRLFTC